jgi:hypothetical protein
MGNFVTVQVMQTNEDHCEIINYFTFRQIFFHLVLEIAPIYKLGNNAYLFLISLSLYFKLIFILDDKRMISTF